jgi:D-alanyl-D-alanine carboxypeptidase/D-alanyl-D-alanine carboxypeptidase (penicillin-binding protein 5/6)
MKKLLSIAAVVLILLSGMNCANAEGFSIDAPAYILVDARTGQVLLEKNADRRMYPASTTSPRHFVPYLPGKAQRSTKWRTK